VSSGAAGELDGTIRLDWLLSIIGEEYTTGVVVGQMDVEV